MIKTIVSLSFALLGCAAYAQTPLPATDVTSQQIQAFIKALPPNVVSDRPIRVVDVGGYHVGVYGVSRPKNSRQQAILHETKVTEIYQVLDGAGTLVTGGEIVDPKKTRTASSAIGHGSITGPSIKDGVSRRLSKGDVVIIPGGTPHWWSNLESDLTYLIYRPDPESTIHLK